MTQSRKQREIAKRHALFLEIGKRILHEEGFHMLSMERIAELAEYSKGTVYQHFTCKEEILIQLCIEAMTQLLTLFKQAVNMEGTNRDHMIGIFFAQQRWARLGGNRTEMLQHLSMHGVRDKITEQSLLKHNELEQTIFGLVKNIVDQAIKDGDLLEQEHLQPEENVFGLWSLCTGGQILQTSELPLQQFGIDNPDLTILRTLVLALDGLGWQPLHNEKQFNKLLEHLDSELNFEAVLTEAELTNAETSED